MSNSEFYEVIDELYSAWEQAVSGGPACDTDFTFCVSCVVTNRRYPDKEPFRKQVNRRTRFGRQLFKRLSPDSPVHKYVEFV